MPNTNFEQKLSQFKTYLKKMKSYDEAIGLMYWDMRTGAPKKGIAIRSEVVGVLSGELFRMSVSDEMGEMLGYLSEPEQLNKLSHIEQRSVTECKKDYDRSKRIPAQKYEEYVVLTSQAESVWEEAKEEADFAKFRPYLEKIVATNLEFIDLWGYKGHKYNTLLDMYEPDMTVAKLDQVFGALREKVVPLLAAIQDSPHQPNTGFLKQTFNKEQQKTFSLFILKQMGYDFEAGRLDETVHPFATGLNPGDVRITTRYVLNDVNSALFGTIHEGGHALYEQNISPDLVGTPLATGASMGIHESQSRFWENMIGRSRPFWNRYYGDLQKAFPSQLDAVSVDDYYKATNEVRPSLIRTEADELTYNLHIMVRYEIEKELFSEQVRVSDLPEVWNQKYRDYLGIAPTNNGEGVLQDVHWAGGSFGYFPSYALGNMYAAQIRRTIRQELPDFDSLVEGGNLLPIRDWLTEKIYRHGKSLTPAEIITQVTGEELNPDYLVQYFNDKFGELYKL
ncbi:carboxypeptidase M32 [Paenibacillus xerothermodurans]|uniref:Metal-dependent carboxypeptidase n=1 Tax=Paenibacillus xerothermodurans TaxID=1977292 RepID=A0A2W1NQU6_PAEXE|nr:carboxypeptidase M32 [Paenibacillus xerothermodurans]PZE21865.1 carboxypeptidase M32 [Paenibacillus xerothermodurans]